MISGLGSNADQRLLGSRSSDRREDKPVAWMPPRSAHLPLQNPKLMPQGDNLSVKLRLLPIANTQQVDQKTGNGVHQAWSGDDPRPAHSAARDSQIELTSRR